MKKETWTAHLCASLVIHALFVAAALLLGSSSGVAEQQPIEVELGMPTQATAADDAAPMRAPLRGGRQTLRKEEKPSRETETAEEPVPPPSHGGNAAVGPAKAVPAAAVATPAVLAGDGAARTARIPVSAAFDGGERPKASAPPAGDATGESGSRLPSVVAGPPPPYPWEARSKGWMGKVRVRVLISEQGTVKETVVVSSSGHESLDDAARQGLRHWLFQPARKDGRYVAAWVVVPVSFRLD